MGGYSWIDFILRIKESNYPAYSAGKDGSLKMTEEMRFLDG
jgi:hypothetical protein